MIRPLFLLHRYLGIAVGFVLLLWCLSGFVMMYVPYPEMEHGESLQTLAPVNFRECCSVPEHSWLGLADLSSVTIEMLDSQTPVLRVSAFGYPATTWDLLRGVEVQRIDEQVATRIASRVAANLGMVLGNDTPEVVASDQWTLTGIYNQHRPLYLFKAGDTDQTELYISGSTGEVVLTTTEFERFWNYLGAVVHWLYPTVLRRHPELWAQVVIWLSFAGVFLTATGLYIGVSQLRYRWTRRSLPLAGVALWHHYVGLAAGLAALLWVSSGLLSMNPWGLLEGENAFTETRALQEGTLTWTDAAGVVKRLPDFPVQPNVVSVEIYRSAGSLFVATTTNAGARERFDAVTFQSSPLQQSELQNLAAVLLSDVPPLDAETLATGDAYYYENRAPREFPVFRIIANDDERRRYYLSATTGQLVIKVDSSARWYRWLFAGLHRADFNAELRDSPIWDSLILLLLFTVTVLCGTGTYLGFRRLKS